MGMTVAAFVTSCLGLIVAGLAAWYGRGQKRAAELSAAEAKRSADAAAEVAEVEKARRADEVAEAERRRVSFVLSHKGGHQYLLRSVGTDSAYGVHVDTGGLGFPDEVTEFEEFAAGDEHRYTLTRTTAPELAERVVVTWHQRADRSDGRRTAKLVGP